MVSLAVIFFIYFYVKNNNLQSWQLQLERELVLIHPNHVVVQITG